MLKYLNLQSPEWLKYIKLSKYIIPYKYHLIVIGLATLAGVGVGLVQPLLFAKIITSICDKNTARLIFIAAILMGTHFIQVIANYFTAYFVPRVNANIVFDLKTEAFNKIINLPISAFNDIKKGEYLSRLNGDMASIANIFVSESMFVLVEILKLLVLAVILIKLSPIMSACVFLFVPAILLTVKRSGSALNKIYGKIATTRDKYCSTLDDTISGIREVISLGMKKSRNQIFNTVSNHQKQLQIMAGRTDSFSSSLISGFSYLLQICVIGLGYYLLMHGNISTENLIAFLTYSMMLIYSVLNVSKINDHIQEVRTSTRRLVQMLDSFNIAQEVTGNVIADDMQGVVRFNSVDFGYAKGVPILEQITFTAHPGQKVAIVGKSGSGKTTIFNLLLRLYTPWKGSITVDGIYLKEYTEDALRDNITVVHQEPYLFSASIKNNLICGVKNVSRDSIYKACIDAYIHDEIMELPDQYDTLVGNGGYTFSVGQKQRVAIARAFLRNSKIVLFDEPTSALDAESAYLIECALKRISPHTTLILIAHKLSTIINSDHIIILNDGKILDIGNHADLIQRNEFYQQMFEKEFAGANSRVSQIPNKLEFNNVL